MSLSAPRVPTLDGWRAVAVLIVVWGHLAPGFYATEAECYRDSLSRFGGFGVDVFFGISGLIITKLLLDEYRQSGRLNFRGFYVRRAFRILPPCFLYLGVVVLTVGVRTPLEWISSAFFFRNYIPDAMATNATKHLWSLAVEEHFYLFWPLLVAVIVGRLGFEKAPKAIAWIAIACGLWRVADAQNGISTHWLPQVPVHFRTDLRLDALLWGCAAAFLLTDARALEKLRRGFSPWMFGGVLLLALGCVAMYSQLTSLWLAILIPVALLGTILHPEWALSRILDHHWTRALGRISYSLYLWQQLFLVSGWEKRNMMQRFPWNILLAVAIAALSYQLLEKPCMALGRRLSARMNPTPSARELQIISV